MTPQRTRRTRVKFTPGPGHTAEVLPFEIDGYELRNHWREMMLQIMDESGKSMIQLADEAGISWATLYNWKNGKTKMPRMDKLDAVARMCGYIIVFQRYSRNSPGR